LVGAGPGDPGLITVKGRQCLERAEVVVYDYLANPELLRYVPESAEVIYAGKKAGSHSQTQEETTQLLVEKTLAGNCVVRLKGGDPFLFGRGGEEVDALADAGCRYEVVPGVTSAIAAPAYAGIPVTHRSHNAALTIFTGHEDPTKASSGIDYNAIASMPGTKVMLMGIERLGSHTDALIAAGLPESTPITLVRWGTLPRQEVLTGVLSDISAKVKKHGFKAPAIAVIGSGAALDPAREWFMNKPLFGKRIAVTRTRAQAGQMLAALRDLGADAFEMPLIKIDPPKDKRAFYELVADAHIYDWLIFTSPNGVDAFFKAFFEIYDDARSIGGIRIAAIGPATTARVKAYHLAVDLQPEKYVAEAVLEALEEQGSVENSRFLLARAEGAREMLAVELTKRGAIVDEAIAYRTVPETADPAGGLKRFKEDGADIITFTSSSTVENFLNLRIPWPEGLRSASIGPVTSGTLRDHGLPVDIESPVHDIPGLVEAIQHSA